LMSSYALVAKHVRYQSKPRSVVPLLLNKQPKPAAYRTTFFFIKLDIVTDPAIALQMIDMQIEVVKI
jgi:hypothetical protein